MEGTILDLWIAHVQEVWNLRLPKAAQVANTYEGFSDVQAILAPYVADAFLGRLGMAVLSASASLIVSLFFQKDVIVKNSPSTSLALSCK